MTLYTIIILVKVYFEPFATVLIPRKHEHAQKTRDFTLNWKFIVRANNYVSNTVRATIHYIQMYISNMDRWWDSKSEQAIPQIDMATAPTRPTAGASNVAASANIISRTRRHAVRPVFPVQGAEVWPACTRITKVALTLKYTFQEWIFLLSVIFSIKSIIDQNWPFRLRVVRRECNAHVIAFVSSSFNVISIVCYVRVTRTPAPVDDDDSRKIF